MKNVEATFFTFDEFKSFLRQHFFTHKELFEVEIVDRYFWKINFYPDDLDGDTPLTISDFDTLPAISKQLGKHFANTHVSHDGIWLEGEERLYKPRRVKKQKG